MPFTWKQIAVIAVIVIGILYGNKKFNLI